MNANYSSYYDIDDILAEEELIPINNLLDFSHLAHLDPDYVHEQSKCVVSPSSQSSQSPNNSDDDSCPGATGRRLTTKKRKMTQQYLPENTRFKMPLWSIKKWSELNFVRLSLPKHFNRKGRDKLDADPVSVDLHSKSERFFMSGMALIDLIHTCVQGHHRNSTTNSRRNNNLHNESQEIKRTLLMTYTGARLRRTFDWTLSNIEDDVSSYTKNLTVMEQKLFRCGAAASHAFFMWKLHGSRRINVSETALRANVMSATGNKNNCSGTTQGMTSKRSHSRVVSPNNNKTSGGGGSSHLSMPKKRLRSH